MARLRDRHLNHYLARAEEAAPKLGDAYQQLWLNWLEGEHENLRAALAWALESDHSRLGCASPSPLPVLGDPWLRARRPDMVRAFARAGGRRN
jgi:predicted ATPase